MDRFVYVDRRLSPSWSGHQTDRQEYIRERECCPLLAFAKTAGNLTREPVVLQYVVYCMYTAVGHVCMWPLVNHVILKPEALL